MNTTESVLPPAIQNLRTAGIYEGISFLILLLIAMPIKYIGGNPWPVKITGWIHGVLFVWYNVVLLIVWIKYRWSFLQVITAFLASFVPFGTFIQDKKLRKYKPA